MQANQSVLNQDAIMSGRQEVLIVFYINHMKIHRIRTHIAEPQGPR